MLLTIISNIVIFVQTTEYVGRAAAKEFVENDPTGATMAIIAMTVVFGALVLLFLLLRLADIVLNGKIKFKRSAVTEKQDETQAEKNVPSSGEVNAAISFALYLYKTRLHDIESFKLTINRVSRTYSPWSSKIYSLRKTPERIIRR